VCYYEDKHFTGKRIQSLFTGCLHLLVNEDCMATEETGRCAQTQKKLVLGEFRARGFRLEQQSVFLRRPTAGCSMVIEVKDRPACPRHGPRDRGASIDACRSQGRTTTLVSDASALFRKHGYRFDYCISAIETIFDIIIQHQDAGSLGSCVPYFHVRSSS
jgi:hypothetical protein